MKSEVSRNVLLIALAVRLQRLVKHLPNNHTSAERISRKSLADAYVSDGLSNSEEGARKKASRYMDEMDHIFGLLGSEKNGYVMARKFDTFRDMFAFWLERISPPGRNDKRLHVMLSGLLHAIDNAFSSDPIVIPELARQLKQRYDNRNIRDTREPLAELFDNSFIAGCLQLCEGDDDALFISPDMDPLLLRLRSRSEVGGNADVSINLARPGRIHVIFEHAIADLPEDIRQKIRNIAEAVSASHIWQLDSGHCLPYLLFREGKRGPLMLTMRNLNHDHFEDISVDELPPQPATGGDYRPFRLDPVVWNHFRQLTG